MSTPLEQYRQHYLLSSVILEEASRRLIIDQHQKNSLDTSKPIYLFDLDHTILNTNALKELLRHSLAEFDITPQQFDQTYQQAKTRENFYDFYRHLELLAAIIAPVHQVGMLPARIEEFLFKTIDQSASQLIYTNIKDWLHAARPRNVLIATSGTGEWQRQKVVACLTALDWQPQAVLLSENTPKGWVIDKLYQLIQSVQDTRPQLIMIDDNESELEHIAETNQDRNVSLFRIKQPNGQYNDKITNQKLGIIEIDCISKPNLQLTDILPSPDNG